MIVLDRVHKAYRTIEGRQIVLQDISVVIPEGRSLGVLGANGSGKSTLIRLLAGTERPDAGRISRGTKAVSFPLGFGGTMHPKLSGLENVVFLARLYDVDEHEAAAYVEGFAELGAYFRMPVGTYSAGMRARLAFGACLAIQFDVYLIDEVTSVGDARFRVKCLDAFRQRMDRADVIMVSHDYETMRAYCDLGAVLSGGGLMLFDDLEAAIEHHARAMRKSPISAMEFS
ncbi:MAG: capsular polysaccharide transport system permease protein kpsT [Acetobacteraceae bacterium]|jgi:capsular polysaccharide transport system ATP-binding protein|nr:transporter ATP-binding protein [Rhodopila sp.]MEA2731737.1 capsular polysaccharide transport system permease protein kpsT [Acetobacteraceae bacterium]MEA2768236.1 capsular polysaccharide transport system permease protein kpsT [Acetobacteraceae bacterium]